MPERIELPDTEWRRVSPKYIVVDVVGYLVTALVIVGAAAVPTVLAGWTWGWWVVGALAAIFLLTIALTPRRVRAIGFQLREDDLLFRRGLMWQRFVSVPYGRMQLVDINRGPVARSVGLSELKFVTAAAATGIVIPGLPEGEADALRDRLVELAESRRAGL